MARQPILDLLGKVHGYELLYRDGPQEAFSGDGDLATCTMLDNVVIFGMEQLTGGLPAFVNCTSESLIERFVEVLPPNSAVLEILESLELTGGLIASCKRLKAGGFRIALDDFSWRPGIEPLVELADYIKVDYLATGAEERRGLLRRLQGSKCILVAEKIETPEDFQLARNEGFKLFQGYYFCRPTLMKSRKIPANCMLHMKILKQLQCEPLELGQLSQLIKLDPSLTFRLLRLANSPICAVRQKVRSIQSALVVMGDEMLSRVLTLAVASEWNAGRPPVILNLAFTRGRFCELAAKPCGLDPTEQYLLGMLSLLPAMLSLPMEELTPLLPFRDEIRDALLGAGNRERSLLHWVERYEHGDWAGCDAVAEANGLNRDEMIRCYADAVVWAEAAVHSAS